MSEEIDSLLDSTEALSEEVVRLRRTNKILRISNSSLRSKIQALKEDKDEVFLALCETDKAAEAALGELWGSGEMDCGPEDYDWMVEQALIAIREKKQRDAMQAALTPVIIKVPNVAA